MKMPSPLLLRFGPYRLEGASGQLWRHTQLVKLPPKVAAALWCLATQAGQVVTRGTLFDAVWAETVVGDSVLTVCIRELRRVLGDDPKRPRYIETVHRRGYRFVAPVERLEDTPSGDRAVPLTDVPSPAPAAGLVGREAEMAQIQACLERARGGQRQVLFVSGEAGMGKTALLEACVTALKAQETAWVAWGQCVESYGLGTGYLPVLEALGRLCRGPTGPMVLAQLRQWAPTWLAQLTGVLSPSEQARLQRHIVGTTRERMLRELADALEALTAVHLGVLVLEDLHWSDPSTVEVLTMLARRREAARLVVLGTYRPAELILRAHPLKQAKVELHLHGQCAELILSYLRETAVATYVALRFPAQVAQTIAPLMYQRTAGHPLFMVHMAAYLAQQAGLEAHTGVELAAQVAAAADTVPPGVQQLIELQLGQLSADEQRLLEMASAVGVEFAVASVAAGLQTTLDLVEESCEALAQRGPFLEAGGLAAWPDGTVSGQYRFRHAVYQQVLYRRLSEARRVQGHRRIGERLEAGYGHRTAEIALVLAGHFARGEDAERAVTYHAQAGQQALVRSAHQEAIGHLTAGLERLATLPISSWHVQAEINLQTALGKALLATQGYTAPTTAQAYQRVRDLSQQAADTPELLQALWGLYQFHSVRGEHQLARALAEQLLAPAQRTQDRASLLVGYFAVGGTLYYLGEFAASADFLGQAEDYYERQQHSTYIARYGVDVGVFCRSLLAFPLWCSGYPDRALQKGHEALTLAQEFGHPFSVAVARARMAQVHQFRREVGAAYAWAETLITFATDEGFAHYVAMGRSLQAWAVAAQAGGTPNIGQLHQSMMSRQAIGIKMAQAQQFALLAELYAHAQRVGDALDALTDAWALAQQTGEAYYTAELHRLQGEILLHQSAANAAQAETCFQRALTIARRQQAKSLELRAAMSLSRLWQQHGKQAEAWQLLSDVYGWFTEGFETADLQEARSLLDRGKDSG
jgi:DNA-binding winged helix-turn-helix (wHTH) protein/predicted ATPase